MLDQCHDSSETMANLGIYEWEIWLGGFGFQVSGMIRWFYAAGMLSDHPPEG